MKNKVLKAVIIIIMIITLTIADFIVVGMNLATYALENVNNTTNTENVKFAAYFKTEQGETSYAEQEINNTQMMLNLDIAVEDVGYFDGVITLENSNFKFKENTSIEGISKIEKNKITLERVRAGNTTSVEIGIEPVIEEKYSIDMLNKESNLKLLGNYTNNDEETIKVEATKNVTLDLLVPSDIDSELKSKVITNRIYKIGEVDKKIIQLELNSKVLDNLYPIESTILEVALPDEVEDVNVITKGTYATNGETEKQLEENKNYTWDKTNKLLTIMLLNNNKDGKISWMKNSVDSVIVTLVLPAEATLGTETYSVKSQIKLLENKAKTITKELTYNLAEEADGIIRASIENSEEIYKGKLYSKEERPYQTTTKIEVNYSNLIENSILEEKTIYRTENQDKMANIEYKTTSVNKAEVQKILGEEGTLRIRTGLEEIIITNDTQADENGNILITHAAGVKELQIEITKAVGTGIIRLNHTKAIKAEGYTREEINSFKHLVEQVNVKYITAQYNFERIKELKETTSEVGFIVTPQIISAEENKEMQMAITLKTDNEKYELFENPTFTITMPEGVNIIGVSNQTISASDGGLTISKLETNGQREIKIEISGKQQKYITSEINTQINFTANVSIEKLMPNKIDRINMQYTNQNKTYNIQSEPINIVASNSSVATQLKLENYNGYGMSLEKHSDNTSIVKGEIPLESTETINVPIKYTIINNYDTEITVTAKVIATLTDKNLQKEELINYSNSGITIEAKSMQLVEYELEIPAGLYYSEKINVEAIVEYTYSGTEYSLPNNIVLSTEEKEGIRNISVLDNKIKLETFAQRGDGTGIRVEDEVYNEQIVEYIIEVTNISNETISNIQITNKHENGNIYDLKEVLVTNREEEFIQHIYAELETNEKTFILETLNPGQSKELICRVVAKKSQGENVTSANFSILADGIEEQLMPKISNSVKDASLKISTKNALKNEVQMYGNDTLFLLTNVKNLTNKKMTDVKVKLYMSEGLTYLKDYVMEATDIEGKTLNVLSNITFNEKEQYVEVKIKELKPNQEIIISSFLYMEALPLEQLETTEIVYAIAENIVSNSMRTNIKQEETSAKVIQKVNILENQKVKHGEKVIIIGEITNTGYIDTTMVIEDELPDGLEIQKVEIIKNNQIIEKTQDAGKDSIYISCEVEKGETIFVRIETIVNTSKIVTGEITNKIVVVPKKGESATSNEVVIQIESNIDTDTGIEEPGEPENPDTPNNPDEPENPEVPNPGQGSEEPEEKKYTISGNAWFDKNNNGIRENDEAIKDIIVKIIDLDNKNTFLKNSDGKEIEIKTDSNGLYELKEIPEGNYSIIFKYNTNIYELKPTSDIKDYIIGTTNEKVAITSNIKLQENKTINLELMEKTEFDLRIDKYITKVILQTSKETKTIDYTKQKLVREEIHKKYISGATVLVEYTLEVSNIGELAGYATEIIDYLPGDMEFHSELNTQWFIGEDNNLYNTSLASININPGESKTIKLVLLKTMNNQNTGVTLNNAEISESINSKEYADIDKTNNQSKAEMIVNTATGTIFTYAMVVLNAMLIVLVGIYVINKKIVRKVRI